MVDAKVVEICVSKMNLRIGDFEMKYIVDAVNKVTMPFQELTISELAVVMFCAISYHLYNLKNVKNTHGGVLLLGKLQRKACNFTKSNTPPWYQIAQRITIDIKNMG